MAESVIRDSLKRNPAYVPNIGRFSTPNMQRIMCKYCVLRYRDVGASPADSVYRVLLLPFTTSRTYDTSFLSSLTFCYFCTLSDLKKKLTYN